MNLVDCVVTEVMSSVYSATIGGLTYWCVDVEYNSWGSLSEKSFRFTTRKEAEEIEVGYKFLS